MRYLIALLTFFCLTATCWADVLPFPVSIGGNQAAMTEDSSIVAYIGAPVAAGANLAVKEVTGQIIVNIFPSDAKGNVDSSAQAVILLFDAGSSKSMSANMQGKTLAPGWYLANVVGGGNTSRICFQIK